MGRRRGYAKEADSLKKKLGIIITISAICLFVLSSCSNDKKQQYYSDKTNYISVTGTVTHIKYNSENDALYLGFSDLQPTCDDNTFKICNSLYVGVY